MASKLPDDVPEKVVLAKLRSMVRRGVLDAECTCGCHGGYRMTD